MRKLFYLLIPVFALFLSCEADEIYDLHLGLERETNLRIEGDQRLAEELAANFAELQATINAVVANQAVINAEFVAADEALTEALAAEEAARIAGDLDNAEALADETAERKAEVIRLEKLIAENFVELSELIVSNAIAIQNLDAEFTAALKEQDSLLRIKINQNTSFILNNVRAIQAEAEARAAADAELQSQLNTVKSDLADAREELQKAINENASNILELQGKVADLEAEDDRLQGLINANANAIKADANRLGVLEAEIAEAANHLDWFDGSNDRDDSHLTLSESVLDLKAKILDVQQYLQNQIDTNVVNISNNSAAIAVINTKLTALTTSVTTLISDLDEVENDIITLTNTQSLTLSDIEGIKLTLENHKNNLTNLHASVASLTSELSDTSSETLELKVELENKIKEANDKITEAEKDIQDLENLLGFSITVSLRYKGVVFRSVVHSYKVGDDIPSDVKKQTFTVAEINEKVPYSQVTAFKGDGFGKSWHNSNDDLNWKYGIENNQGNKPLSGTSITVYVSKKETIVESPEEVLYLDVDDNVADSCDDLGTPPDLSLSITTYDVGTGTVRMDDNDGNNHIITPVKHYSITELVVNILDETDHVYTVKEIKVGGNVVSSTSDLNIVNRKDLDNHISYYNLDTTTFTSDKNSNTVIGDTIEGHTKTIEFEITVIDQCGNERVVKSINTLGTSYSQGGKTPKKKLII